MNIRIAKSDDRGAWDAYVKGHPGASPYHLYAWKLAVEATYGHRGEYLIAERDGAVCGVLPMFVFKVPLAAPRLVSLPFCDLGGVLADDSAAERALTDAAIESGRRRGASAVVMRDARPTDSPDSLPRRRLAANKVRMVLDLPSSSEAMMKALASKVRSQVRKAMKNGLEFAWGDGAGVDEFFAVFGQNMRDLGSPTHPRRLFENVLRHFGEDARLGLVRLEGRTVAGGVLLGAGAKVCVPWASSLREYNRLGPNMLLYWSFLEHASDGPPRLFDFGRSTEGEGTYRFKKQWGAQPVPLHWTEIRCRSGKTGRSDEAEDEAGEGPGRGRRWAEAIWRRLPVPMANRVGPLVRRYISL